MEHFSELILAEHIKIKQFLGRGAFAVVYSGTYGRPGEQREAVAVKVLQPVPASTPASEEEYTRMFLREAACTTNLAHKHIIRCLGVARIPPNHPGIAGLSKTAWAIVLELAEPYTTKSLIIQYMTENRRTYNNLQAFQWSIQIASALAHLHTRNPRVIHRDIKHENVLLKREEPEAAGPGGKSARAGGKGRLVAKLADLGLHVVVEHDRSVMLRRKSVCVNRSVHSRPQSQASGLTLTGGAASESPFYSVSAGPFARGPSRLSSDSEPESEAETEGEAEGEGKEKVRGYEQEAGAGRDKDAGGGPASAAGGTGETGGGFTAVLASLDDAVADTCETSTGGGSRSGSLSSRSRRRRRGPDGGGGGATEASGPLVYKILSESDGPTTLVSSPAGVAASAAARTLVPTLRPPHLDDGGSSSETDTGISPVVSAKAIKLSPAPHALNGSGDSGGAGGSGGGAGAAATVSGGSSEASAGGSDRPDSTPSSRRPGSSRRTSNKVLPRPTDGVLDRSPRMSYEDGPASTDVRPKRADGETRISTSGASAAMSPTASLSKSKPAQPRPVAQADAVQLETAVSYVSSFPPGAIPAAFSFGRSNGSAAAAAAASAITDSDSWSVPHAVERSAGPGPAAAVPTSAAAPGVSAGAGGGGGAPHQLSRAACRVQSQRELGLQSVMSDGAGKSGPHCASWRHSAPRLNTVDDGGSARTNGAAAASSLMARPASARDCMATAGRASCGSLVVSEVTAEAEADSASAAQDLFDSQGQRQTVTALPLPPLQPSQQQQPLPPAVSVEITTVESLRPQGLPDQLLPAGTRIAADANAQTADTSATSSLATMPAAAVAAVAATDFSFANGMAIGGAQVRRSQTEDGGGAAGVTALMVTVSAAVASPTVAAMPHRSLDGSFGSAATAPAAEAAEATSWRTRQQGRGGKEASGAASGVGGVGCGCSASSLGIGDPIFIYGTSRAQSSPMDARSSAPSAQLASLVAGPSWMRQKQRQSVQGRSAKQSLEGNVTSNAPGGSLAARRRSLRQQLLAGHPASAPVLGGLLEPKESIGSIISKNPGLVQPVSLDGSAASGLRSVRSVLRQFQQTELRELRPSSIEWVFGLTGRAGSCMYMAPEVFRKLPYNEKADVFSFGVLLYELLARELLIITYFNTSKGARLGVKQPEDYAEKVCEGFRPPRPFSVSDLAWTLIEACWHDDPVQRPTMEQVLERLTQLRDQEAAGPTDTRAMAGCTAGCVVQ